MKYRTFVAIAAAALACAAASVSAQVVDNLSWLSGGGYTSATGISDDGNVCSAWGDTDPNFTDIAVRWTNFSVFPLGLLPAGAFNSYANDVSPDGVYLTGYGGTFNGSRAFLHTLPGGYTVIPTGGASYCTGSGVTNVGPTVVGTGHGNAFPDAGQAFRWPGGGNPIYLGNVSGQPWSSASAISADASTIVGASGSVAFRWTSALGMVSLGSLPGQTSAVATGVSPNGSVICGIWRIGSNDRGFRWTAATGMVDLGLFPNGGTALRPRSLSADGNVIVGQAFDNSGLFAFIWTAAGGLQRLSDHLASRGIDNTNRTYTDCKGVNPSGTAFCGLGTYFGSPYGFVVRGLACPSNVGFIGWSGIVCPNQLETISVTATGPALTYRWIRNGVQIFDGPQPSGSVVSGASTYLITINPYLPGDEGTFQVAIGSGGACETFTGPLTLPPPLPFPVITLNPTNTNGCVGSNVSLSSAATYPGSLVYRWERESTDFPGVFIPIFDQGTGYNSTFSGTGTTTLTINGAQLGDATRYRCRAYPTYDPGVCQLPSTNVSAAAFVTMIPGNSISFQPQDTGVCLGDNDAFFSVSASPPNDTFTYQWQKKNPIFFNVYNDIFDGPTGNGGNYGGTQTPTLTIAGVYAGDLEYYRCVVTGTCQAMLSNDALLSATPDAFIFSGPDVVAACNNGTGSMTVSASPPGSTYQWQRYVGPCLFCFQDIYDGPTGNGGSYTGTQSPTLTIFDLDILDTTSAFRCIVTGPCGGEPAASGEALFSLLDSPVIQTQPIGGPVCPSGTKQLTVTLAPGNYGTVTYQWWRYIPAFPIFQWVSNGTLPSGATAAGAQTATLTLTNFQQQDAGQYYCMVTADCNQVPSAEVTLTWCPADFDCSGTVGVTDIFAFLSAWFAQSPAAEFDGNPGITVPDIFAFLSLWFAGCP